MSNGKRRALECPLCNGTSGNSHLLPNDPMGHAICMGNATRCPACAQWFCNAACIAGHPAGTDASGHPICPNRPATQCPGCTQWFCNAACIGGHPSGADPSGHPICATSATRCPACTQWFCNAACIAGHPAGTDANGHATCPSLATRCPACTHWFCDAACIAGHPAGTDANGHATCATRSATQCPACAQWFCDAACIAGHPAGADANGHPTCANLPATQCGTCTLWYCNAACAGGHTTAAAGCGHATCPTTRVTCGGCTHTFCPVCKGTWTIDICTPCTGQVVAVRVANKLNVRHQFVPGSKGRLRRQVTLEGPIAGADAGGRGSPPPPLSSGRTDPGDETGDIKQFDNGHLIALELDGEDDHRCIVPMVRQFNRSPGRWRLLETNIGLLMGGTNLTDVNGGVVDATPGSHPTTIDLSLRTLNTVNQTWQMEVHLFYHRTMGDPRVPVWLYVRVLRNQRLRAHFSVANRCTTPAAVPTANEIAEYQAATDFFAAAGNLEFTKLTADDTRAMYTRPPGPGAPPYQILQFMEDVNDYAVLRGRAAVFPSLRKLGQRGGMTPYDDEQRPTIRKFNRWKNNGALLSDVTANGQYVGERRDLYAGLSECGSRSAPEVDHVAPSYQQGANLYINGRLVSFYHNHLYREKKESGSIPVNELLFRTFRRNDTERLAFMSSQARYWDGGAERVASLSSVPARWWIYADDVVAGTTGVRAYLDARFADAALLNDGVSGRTLRVSTKAEGMYRTFAAPIIARQKFLQAHDGRETKYGEEQALGLQYTASMGGHQNAVADFIADQTNPERQRLLDLIATATRGGGGALPLCRPSDVLNPGGGEASPPPAGPAFVPVTPGAARLTAHYLTVKAAYDTVKVL